MSKIRASKRNIVKGFNAGKRQEKVDHNATMKAELDAKQALHDSLGQSAQKADNPLNNVTIRPFLSLDSTNETLHNESLNLALSKAQEIEKRNKLASLYSHGNFLYLIASNKDGLRTIKSVNPLTGVITPLGYFVIVTIDGQAYAKARAYSGSDSALSLCQKLGNKYCADLARLTESHKFFSLSCVFLQNDKLPMLVSCWQTLPNAIKTMTIRNAKAQGKLELLATIETLGSAKDFNGQANTTIDFADVN